MGGWLDQISDTLHDWASSFSGVDTRKQDGGGDASATASPPPAAAPAPAPAPAAPPPAAPTKPSWDDLYNMGLEAGKEGRMPICPDTDIPGGEAHYEDGLAAGQRIRSLQHPQPIEQSVRQSTPGEYIETRSILCLVEGDEPGARYQLITGTHDYLDAYEANEQQKINKAELDGLLGLGETPRE